MGNAITHNGDSKNYCLTAQEAEELMKKTDGCSMIVASQEEVSKVCNADVMAATIAPASKINEGIRPEEQGDAIIPEYAAEFGDGVVIVTDASKQQSSHAEEKEENETQKASREKLELEQSAEAKYEHNNSQTTKER